jgi:hypothetical protein
MCTPMEFFNNVAAKPTSTQCGHLHTNMSVTDRLRRRLSWTLATLHGWRRQIFHATIGLTRTVMPHG